MPTLTSPKVHLVDGQAVTDSREISSYFGKRHERVLDKISHLECSPNFTQHNFVLSEYQDSTGRTLPCFQITKDGFVFLAMGFTGKKAAKFKEAYINAFNELAEKSNPQFAAPPTSSIADTEKYRLLNAMIREFKLPDNPMVISTVDLIHLAGMMDRWHKFVPEMEKWAGFVESKLNELKRKTGSGLLLDN